MFLAIDGCLLIVVNVARGLVVYPKTLAAAVAAELPFMATEEILMAAVRAGGDRQALHESIRAHSMAAAERVKRHGEANDLLARLAADPAYAGLDLAAVLDPKAFVGRAPEQVDRFVGEVVDPIRARYADALRMEAGLRV